MPFRYADRDGYPAADCGRVGAARIAERLSWFHINTHTIVIHLPGAKANIAKHSPVEATAVTTERLLSKYCERMVTVGRKLKQYPKPGRVKTSSENHALVEKMYLSTCTEHGSIHACPLYLRLSMCLSVSK